MIFLSVMCTPSCISDALLHVTPQHTQEMVSSFCVVLSGQWPILYLPGAMLVFGVQLFISNLERRTNC